MRLSPLKFELKFISEQDQILQLMSPKLEQFKPLILNHNFKN